LDQSGVLNPLMHLNEGSADSAINMFIRQQTAGMLRRAMAIRA
jgi:hypothetical protein